MAEYIEREAALDIVNGWREQLIPTYGKNDEYVKCLETVAEHLETLRAADVVERKPMAEDVEEFVARLRDRARREDEYYAHGGDVINEAANAIESTNKAYQMISEAYEAEVTKQNWIPVTERLPDNIDEEVLVCNEGYGKDGTGFATVAVYNGNGWLECWERKQYLACITYWMPLPEPPKEE